MLHLVCGCFNLNFLKHLVTFSWFFYTPYKQRFGRYIGVTYSVFPSVYPSNLSGLYLSYGEALEVPTSHKDCLKPKGLSRLRPKVILASSRSLEGKVHNSCPGNFLFEKHWNFLLNTDCLWPEDVSWFCLEVILASSRSLEGKVQKN